MTCGKCQSKRFWFLFHFNVTVVLFALVPFGPEQDDVDAVAALFLDSKASAKLLQQNPDKYISQ